MRLGARRMPYRSPASGLPRRGRALAVARSATGSKCDGYLNTRARQVLRFVLPRPSRPRRRSAPPATDRRDRDRVAGRGAQNVHPPGRDGDRFLAGTLELRPSWRVGPSAIDGQQVHLPFTNAGCAKRVELTAARRQNAIPFTCERSAPKGQGAPRRTECDGG
jgi:hypothetical protein